MQFRQSIKRIFGIHTKGKNSQTEKGYNNTVLSPAHKLSSLNNTKYNSSETSSVPRTSKERKATLSEEIPEIVTNEYQKHSSRNYELCTIQENKTASDTEKSGESAFDNDSSGNKSMDMFGESCKVLNERSPVLTFMDSDRLLFSKRGNIGDDNDVNKNVYGNEAYEVTDEKEVTCKIENEVQSAKRRKMMRQSYSLDFSKISSENKIRKLSVETKLESLMQIKETISKLFDQDSKQNEDNFKSYLCTDEKNEMGIDEL